MSENAQYSCVSSPANILCWISSESEALTGFYTARVVSPNLGKQYNSFELEGTLRAQARLPKCKIYLTEIDTLCAR